MKALLLAGGRGSRLFPLTVAVNKHLLAVHDKPMLYYPLSTVMLVGARDIAVVASPEDLSAFERLLGDGSHLGVRFTYVPQHEPRGIADALRAAEAFLAGEPCLLALGDTLLIGSLDTIRDAMLQPSGATAFAYSVRDPSGYGVVELDAAGSPLSVEEKPGRPRSSLALAGLYVLDARAVAIARSLAPSARGELEITDLLQEYLRRGELRVAPLDRSATWIDMGTPDDLLAASELVATRQCRQRLLVGCVEEVAVRMRLVTAAAMRAHLATLPSSRYRDRVVSLLDG